jgi:hypothetical protein
VLVDGLPVLGGQAVNSIIGTFCGLLANGTHGHQFTHGIADDILRDLGAMEQALHYRHTTMPLIAVPLLLIAACADVGHGAFLMLFALIALFLIGGHFGLHSIAGIFYPSAYRGNGAGWATSVAKVGSIAGPFAARLILSTSLPARQIFAVLAICPAAFVVCVFILGRIHFLHAAPPSPGNDDKFRRRNGRSKPDIFLTGVNDEAAAIVKRLGFAEFAIFSVD